MTKLYIDCEFNGFQGELISMALVADTGEEFYEVLQCSTPVTWVADNVMPILNKEPVNLGIFKEKLGRFLAQFEKITVIADWPEDIMHFTASLLTGPGIMLQTIPEINMIINRKLHSGNSTIPHNALEDARAIKEAS